MYGIVAWVGWPNIGLAAAGPAGPAGPVPKALQRCGDAIADLYRTLRLKTWSGHGLTGRTAFYGPAKAGLYIAIPDGQNIKNCRQ